VVMELYKLILALSYHLLQNVVQKLAFRSLDQFAPKPQQSMKQSQSQITTKGNPYSSSSDVINVLNQVLLFAEKYWLPSSVILQYFHQLYHFIDTLIFNGIFTFGRKSLISPHQSQSYCTAERGIHLKIVCSELETWAVDSLSKHAKDYVKLTSKNANTGAGNSQFQAISSPKLFYSSQAASVMLIDKSVFNDKGLILEHFSGLTFGQIFGLILHYQPSKLSPASVPAGILKQLEGWAKEAQKKLQSVDDFNNVHVPLKMIELPGVRSS